MSLILWTIVGIVAGAVATSAVPRNVLVASKGPWGVPGDLITGVIGAVGGGWLIQNLLAQSSGGWIGSTLGAFVGAVVVLLSLRFAIGGQTA